MNKLNGFLLAKPVSLHTIRNVMHNVFVYGTLKRNEPNNYWLLDSKNGTSKFLSDGFTKKKYPLVIATKYNIPFLLYSPGKGNFVQGEVYQVDDQMLGQLDILEDHPNYYIREEDDILIMNQQTKSTETLTCWVYFLKNFNPDLLKRSYMESYSSSGPHGLPYMDRSKRDSKHNYKIEIKTDNDKTQ